MATASYATVFWPLPGASPGAGLAAALLALWSLTLVNAHGVRTAGHVQLVTTVLKLLPLVAIGTIGFLYFEPGHFQPFNPSGGSSISAVTATVTLTLWAFLGIEVATVPADDVRDPARTLRERFGSNGGDGGEAALRGRRGTNALGRATVSVLAFGFSLWAVAGAGADTVYWGFLLLVAGIPVYVAMRWRRVGSSRAREGSG